MMVNKLKLNTFSSLVFEIVTIVCGFILPRLIMQAYGSGINGLVNSITQFIGIITFLELGVGKVVQSALYKPLVDKDNDQISRVMVSAGKFFKHIAQIMFVYIVAAEACCFAVPFFRDVLDTPDPQHLGAKLVVLFVGAALFALLTALGTRRAEKIFEKVDL